MYNKLFPWEKFSLVLVPRGICSKRHFQVSRTSYHYFLWDYSTAGHCSWSFKSHSLQPERVATCSCRWQSRTKLLCIYWRFGLDDSAAALLHLDTAARQNSCCHAIKAHEQEYIIRQRLLPLHQRIRLLQQMNEGGVWSIQRRRLEVQPGKV